MVPTEIFILICFLIYYTGGCRINSPAGKRRVSNMDVLPEQTAELNVMSAVETISSLDGKNDSTNYASTAAATLAAAICVASIALFATIFLALQVHLRGCAKITTRHFTM